jgi:hypothetical protein
MFIKLALVSCNRYKLPSHLTAGVDQCTTHVVVLMIHTLEEVT